MGLDVSHDAWHGPYSQFNRWRVWVAKQVGIPLRLMEGYYNWQWDEGDEKRLTDTKNFYTLHTLSGENTLWYDTLKAVQELGGPIKWDVLGDHPLRILLSHSDCDGRIHWMHCKRIALELGKILKRVEDDMIEVTYREGPNAGQRMFASWQDGRGIYDGNVSATKRFICGCLEAFKSKEDLLFQ
jgi:hypothetical protein